MATPHLCAEPTALVESFSRELRSRELRESDSEEFRQARSDFIEERSEEAKRRRKEIRRIDEEFGAERSDEELLFDKAKRELQRSIEDFKNLVPERFLKTTSPITWDDIATVVATIQSEWEIKGKDTRVGRANGWVRKMCQGLHNHSAALKMLPAESEYVSLVAGSVTMVLKASANYTSIMEGFAKGIVEINDAVSLVQKSQVYQTATLQRLVMRLYAKIFTYLTKFMKWYTDRSRTRFLRSFNENLGKTFEDDLAEVWRISHMLSNQIQLHMSADIKVSRMIEEDTNADVKYLIKLHEDGDKRSRLQNEASSELMQDFLAKQFNQSKEELQESLRSMVLEYEEKIRRQISGTAIRGLLEQRATNEAPIIAAPRQRRLRSTHETVPSTFGGDQEQGFLAQAADSDNAIIQGPTVKYDSRRLENYFSWDDVCPFEESPWPLLADFSFVARLNEFTAKTESQILYVNGHYRFEELNVLRQSAGGYTFLAREARIPVVSYFCSLSHQEPPPGRSRESVELSAMLYAMIRQLINLLPNAFAAPMPLDEEAFADLDGTLRTWDQATSLMVHIANSIRLPMILFVVDGLSFLEDGFEGAVSRKLEQCVACLMRIFHNANENGRIVKMLFTTAGLSSPLCRTLEERDMLSIDDLARGRVSRHSEPILT